MTKKTDLLPLSSLLGGELEKQIKELRSLRRKTAVAPIPKRIVEAAAAAADEEQARAVLYQHSVFCQTSLPYRNPGSGIREWKRDNGRAHLLIEAGNALDPKTREWVKLDLPFGPKARLVLMHLNQRAVITQSPVVDVGSTFTAFVSKVLQLRPDGRNLPVVKEQLARLSAASISLGFISEGKAVVVHSRIADVTLWPGKDERQRVLWPEKLEFGAKYFADLIRHAVPLDENHIRALAHSSMALDIYSWLALRLHQIPPGEPVTISWLALYGQFGQGYRVEHVKKFRQVFRVALKQVLTVYRAARVEDVEAGKPRHLGGAWRSERAAGLKLFHSAPPVRRLLR